MFKVLAIDGGGVKGAYPAAFLAELESMANLRIAEYFDLIVGTSTGGIIALGLGLGMQGSDILQFYREDGPGIFVRQGWRRALGRYFGPPYDPQPLENALRRRFGESRLGHSKVRLVIPSLNLESGNVHLFKTAHHPSLRQDYKRSAIEVALATAAAPTYFPVARETNGSPLVDGGLWANNPASVAAVEAVGFMGIPKENVRLLSVGCTTELPSTEVGGDLSRFGLFWATRIVDLFMTAQSAASISTAQVLLGKENVIRVSTVVEKGRFSLDGAKRIENLATLGRNEARHQCASIASLFFSERATKFTPVYSDEP